MKCNYCYGVGACPQCWGQAAITELKAEIERLKPKPPLCYEHGEPVPMRQVWVCSVLTCNNGTN